MKKIYLFPLVLLAILLYSIYQFIELYYFTNTTTPLTSTIVYISNIVAFTALIIACFYNAKIIHTSKQHIADDEVDNVQLNSERNAYSITTYIQIAFTISLVTLVAGFLLIRDENPTLLLFTILIFGFSFLMTISSTSLILYIRPDFKLPDPRDKDYQKKIFESYDDGEKYLMLKSLYKLYYVMIFIFVMLLFVLMYYSIFSGQSQLFSILCIGAILLFMQLYYTFGLKPKKS